MFTRKVSPKNVILCEDKMIDLAFDAIQGFGLTEDYIMAITRVITGTKDLDFNQEKSWKTVKQMFNAEGLQFTQTVANAFNWVRMEMVKIVNNGECY